MVYSKKFISRRDAEAFLRGYLLS